MTKPLSEMLDLEELGEQDFRGTNQPLGGGRVFGGQVISQALVAAGRTCPGRPCHSLHAYFLRVGAVTRPIDYAVESVHDGRSFSNRRVVARQQERPIFHLSASFQVPEAGLEFQSPMPRTIPPEGLTVLAEQEELRGRQRSTTEMRVEIRPVPSQVPADERSAPSSKCWWLRIIDPLPDSPLIHQSALAYATDFGLLGTAREAHGIGFRKPGVLVASLDHSLWFHRDFRCGDWMLYAMDCSSTALGRGFVRGQIFSRDGELLASVAQEGVIRVAGDKATKSN